MLNMRNHRPALTPTTPRQRGVCVSDDGGVTFRDVRRDPALIEPVCQASIRAGFDEQARFSSPTRRRRKTRDR